MRKHKTLSILIMLVLVLSTVSLCGCKTILNNIFGNYKLNTFIIYIDDDVKRNTYLINSKEKTAILHYCEYFKEHLVCEVPSQIEYEDATYTVKGIEPRWTFFDGTFRTFSNMDLREIILPSTIEKLDLSFQDNLDYLKAITVHEDNRYFKSIDGVLYTKDGTELVYYPRGKHTEDLLLSKEVKKIDSTVQYNAFLKNIFVENGNAVFKSLDGVLYSADLTELIRYPFGKEGKHFVVPRTVKIIRSDALNFRVIYYGSQSSKLKTVFIPSSVEIIEEYSIDRVNVYCEISQMQLDFDLQQDCITLQWNVSFEEYQSIISTWEDTDK